MQSYRPLSSYIGGMQKNPESVADHLAVSRYSILTDYFIFCQEQYVLILGYITQVEQQIEVGFSVEKLTARWSSELISRFVGKREGSRRTRPPTSEKPIYENIMDQKFRSCCELFIFYEIQSCLCKINSANQQCQNLQQIQSFIERPSEFYRRDWTNLLRLDDQIN